MKPLTAFRLFIEYGGRHNTTWKNAGSYVDPNAVTIFHPGVCAKFIKAPVLMVIVKEDEMEGENSGVSR